MKIIEFKNLSKKNYQKIINRSCDSNQSKISIVENIISDIKNNGDQALIKIGQNFYGQNYNSIMVTPQEIKDAYTQVNKSFIKAINQAIKNITLVNSAQLIQKKCAIVSPETGIEIWREWRPIEKIGIYAPGGNAIYPSCVIMAAIPAIISGCPDIILCSPPNNNGSISPETLIAADLVGIKKIYKIGGAEAIAAMTYGTKTVPKVYKIFGAGNSYVTTAKILIQKEIAIDMPAGPSEVFIIADKYANPKFIAADLLADAEHGPDSSCILVTTSKEIAIETIKQLDKQLSILPKNNFAKVSINKYGSIILVDSINKAVNFCNQYAPEHLEIMTKNSRQLVKKIINAGSIFLGDWTTKSSGDYATGATHILPTNGYAKTYPPLGVDAYGKWMQIQKCTQKGLQKIKNTIEELATTEGLPAHKNSTSIRFKPNYDGLIFDMDGILVDVSLSYRQAIKQTASFFLNRDVSFKEIDKIKNIVGMNNDWDATYALINNKNIPYDKVKKYFQTLYLGTKTKKGLIDNERLFITKKQLEQLKNKYGKMGIATGRPKKEALYIIKKNNLEKIFDCLIALEDVKNSKPKPDPINKVIKILNLKNTIYIGDSPSDIIAAKAANIPSIFVGNKKIGTIQFKSIKEVLNYLF